MVLEALTWLSLDASLHQVDYTEGAHSKGLIPDTKDRRDRLGESEILSSRAIDRAIRPLFPPGFCYETHVSEVFRYLGSKVRAVWGWIASPEWYPPLRDTCERGFSGGTLNVGGARRNCPDGNGAIKRGWPVSYC